jgi:hypothetical protein
VVRTGPGATIGRPCLLHGAGVSPDGHDVGAGGAPSNWQTLHVGATGDPRASSQNNLVLEFLGDYVYAAATNDYNVAVWNDARDGADCPAIDARRAEVQETLDTTQNRVDVEAECPAGFGDTSIYGGSYADPNAT